jgi:hypothetical protein
MSRHRLGLHLPLATAIQLASLCPQNVDLALIPTLQPVNQTVPESFIPFELFLLPSTNLRLLPQHTLCEEKCNCHARISCAGVLETEQRLITVVKALAMGTLHC